MENQNFFERLTSSWIKRPSKEEKKALVKVKGIVLPDKRTVMLDEFSGYTKTKIQIQQTDNYKASNVLEINEPYFEKVYGGHRSLFVYENYEPLIIGHIYTFLMGAKKISLYQRAYSKSYEYIMDRSGSYK